MNERYVFLDFLTIIFFFILSFPLLLSNKLFLLLCHFL